MGKKAAFFCLALLLFTAFVSSAEDSTEEVEVEDVTEDEDYGDDDVRAFLIVRKTVDKNKERDVLAGQPFSVTIELHNAGSSSATGVKVKDALWPVDSFEIESGGGSTRFDRIPAGTTVTYNYTVTPKSSGRWDVQPATVSYRAEDDADEVQTILSTTEPLWVLSSTEKTIKGALKLGNYVTLGLVRTPAQWLTLTYLVSGLGAVIAAYVGYTSISEARKKQRYQKAYEEVQKMK